MTTRARQPRPAARAADELLPKLPLFAQVKDAAYFAAATQVAVGIMIAAYILVLQARYGPVSLKHDWDNLAAIWHFAAIPGIGRWMVSNYDTGRHLFLRNAPETVLSYALVVLAIVKVKPLKTRIPWPDKVLGFLRAPTPYQGRMRTSRWHLDPARRRAARNPDTSGRQYLALLPAMLLVALPGEILAAAAVFGGIAVAHRQGYHAGWLNQDAWWVPIVIGAAGGNMFGHRPALKAGLDIQRSYLRRRLAAAYAAEALLDAYAGGDLPRDRARDQITAMRGTRPGVLYPEAYKYRYALLLGERASAAEPGRFTRLRSVAAMAAAALLAGYGLYAHLWGIRHGLWTP